ncbi:hypothetical protein M7I_4495 [Glarea lozoyensis 74030]|nr:hypothetical protein M7I_4495 [Glarea lozoyensis 74030]
MSMQDELDITSQLEGESGMSLGATSTSNSKIYELEQEVQRLKAELEQKEDDATITDPNWTMAAHDPFDDFNDDDDNMITNYDMEFAHDTEMDTTPTRLNTSFPSPPSTLPNTPTAFAIARDQTSSPVDTEKAALKQRLESLQSHVATLTSTIAFKEDNHARLEEKLQGFVPLDESHDQNSLDAALDTVLTRLALAQSEARDHQNAFTALTGDIKNLGFPISEPDKVLETIAQQFRQARLEIEYLTPGEVVEGFENDKVLEMLVSRIKVLFEKVKRSDESIDQYHDQELLLRQQINTHVSINQDLTTKLSDSNHAITELQEEMQDKETTNQRLKSALESYRKEVADLTQLIEQVERDGQDQNSRLQSEIDEVNDRLQDEMLKHDSTRTMDEGKDLIIMELERRLAAALEAAAEVQEQLASMTAANVEKDVRIEEAQAEARESEKQVAARNARILDLQQEVEAINNSLQAAHATILSLTTENQQLTSKLDAEKARGVGFAKMMNEQLVRSLEMSSAFLGGGEVAVGTDVEVSGNAGIKEGAVVRKGNFEVNTGTAGVVGGKKKRRRYDSGLGFLDEGDEEGDMVDDY